MKIAIGSDERTYVTERGARVWNCANVLCLSLRATSEIIAKEILDAWFNTLLGTDPSDMEAVEYGEQMESNP